MADISSELLQEAIDSVKKFGSVSNAAKALGIPRKTLSGRYNKAKDLGYSPGVPQLPAGQQVIVDSKLKNISKEKRDLEQKYKELLQILDEKTVTLETVINLKDRASNISSEPIKVIADKSVSQSVAVALLSDIHYEELVLSRVVNGLNDYSIDIAKKRLDKYFNNVVKLLGMCRSKVDIETMILWLGGDLITGYIHEELMENNQLSPTQACLELFKILISGIDFFVEHSGCKQILIPTSPGNHGRTTKEKRISTSCQNSYEWLLYNFLSLHYKDSKVVKVYVSESYFTYMDVYDYKLRFHHGDALKYQGGIGGIVIPANKAIDQWNKANRANWDVFGHFHTRMCTSNFVSNGSVIGYGPYSISIKAAYEPPQQSFFLVHPRYGKTIDAPIICQ